MEDKKEFRWEGCLKNYEEIYGKKSIGDMYAISFEKNKNGKEKYIKWIKLPDFSIGNHTNSSLIDLEQKYSHFNRPCNCCYGRIRGHNPGGIINEVFFKGYMCGKESVAPKKKIKKIK